MCEPTDDLALLTLRYRTSLFFMPTVDLCRNISLATGRLKKEDMVEKGEQLIETDRKRMREIERQGEGEEKGGSR